MSKKKLDTSNISNELKSGSVFFQQEKDPVQEVPPVRAVRDVPPVRPTPKREVIRHAFNIYRDQLQSLLKLKSEYMMETGEEKGMSEMLREAIDTYIESQS